MLFLYFIDPGNTAGDCLDAGSAKGTAKLRHLRRLDPSAYVDGDAGGAGTSTGGGTASGSSSSSEEYYDCVFNTPTGLDVDTANGFVYVSDFGNNAIRQVSLSGQHEVVTIAEDPLLNSPYGVVIDVTNQVLYVTSFRGHMIVQIVLDGYYPIALNYNNIFAGSPSGKLFS
jgi:DNA-binding beta-propeller fold protein YncE